MHEHIAILLITLVILGYGYISKLLERFSISGPMVFTTIGILLSSLVSGVVDAKPSTEVITIIAEIALIIVLFSDASTLNLKELRWGIPSRLLFIGLPLTIVLSTLCAMYIFPQESILYLFLMALLLAPTDAALGKAVVSDRDVPLKIRSAINVESGLNDGIVFPIILGALVAINQSIDNVSGTYWLVYVLQQISVGAIIGSFIGYLNARLSLFFIKKGDMGSAYKNLLPLAIAIFAYYVAEYLGGNGFIAAFFAGLLLGNYNESLKENVNNFAESESELLLLMSFMVFGFTFVPYAVEFWDVRVVVYSLLSLTFLRMIPVALSLIGTKLDMATLLFIGWFGPRGIASVLYILIVVDKIEGVKGHETIFSVVTLTILMSIFLHGITAKPFVSLYGKNHH